MKITTVLLDGGGVIVDETELEDVRARIISEILATLIPWYSTYNYWIDVDEAVKSFCPDVYRFVFWKYTEGNLPLFDELYRKHLEIWNRERPRLKLTENFAPQAERLSRDFKLVNAGQYGKEIIDLLKNNGILDRFAYHFTQDDFDLTKPDPRYFEQIAQKADADPSECVMVGDRIDKDVIPSKQVGMKTVLVRTGLHRNQKPRIPFEMPDIELEDIGNLAKSVEEIAGKII